MQITPLKFLHLIYLQCKDPKEHYAHAGTKYHVAVSVFACYTFISGHVTTTCKSALKLAAMVVLCKIVSFG
jgi:hypothetical protein